MPTIYNGSKALFHSIDCRGGHLCFTDQSKPGRWWRRLHQCWSVLFFVHPSLFIVCYCYYFVMVTLTFETVTFVTLTFETLW